jgi:CoA:oxalate CoA-transferase
MPEQPHVLTGLRVLDFTRALAGPSCTRMFAEMGAEVIKIEAGPGGDMTRGPGTERSRYYVQQHLNKKSVCMNLRDPRSLAVAKELVAHVDVVVENFRPGVMARMGMAYQDLMAIKPDIVLCSISALGQTGPLAHKPGYDYIAQAYSGVTSMIGHPDKAPHIPCVGLGDVSTGVTAAAGVLAALRHRDATGRGQHIDVGLLDVYYHYHEVNVHEVSASKGEIQPTRGGRHVSYLCPAGVFRGNDGCAMIMGFLHHWKDLCAAMERPDLLDHPIFGNDADRLDHRDEVIEMIETWLASFPSIHDAVAKLEAHGVPCGPVLSVEETLTHPHLRARGTVRTIKDKLAGEFDIPGHPIRFSGFPNNLPYEAPTLGQHNRSVLSSLLQKSDGELDELDEAGVLVEGPY